MGDKECYVLKKKQCRIKNCKTFYEKRTDARTHARTHARTRTLFFFFRHCTMIKSRKLFTVLEYLQMTLNTSDMVDKEIKRSWAEWGKSVFFVVPVVSYLHG